MTVNANVVFRMKLLCSRKATWGYAPTPLPSSRLHASAILGRRGLRAIISSTPISRANSYPNPECPVLARSAAPLSPCSNTKSRFYSPSNVQMGLGLVHEGAHPIVTYNVPVTSPIHMTYASPQSPPLPYQKTHSQHQQYLHMQQRYDSVPRTNYLPSKYHHPPFQGHQLPERHPMMMRYHPNVQYETSSRILDQPEGTDWAFLE